MGSSFSAPTFKVKLSTAVKRIAGRTGKLNNDILRDRKEIAVLLQQGKDESARIKVESTFHLLDDVRLFELLTLMCNLLHARTALIANSQSCPDDVVEACASIIYAASRTDIGELMDVAKMLGAKFGEDWAKPHVNNSSRKVNVRVVQCLSVQPPSFDDAMAYMQACAKQFDIKWEPTEDGIRRLGAVLPRPAPADAAAAAHPFRAGDLPLGTLTVTVHEAQRLHVAQLFGKQDPYVKVSVRGQEKLVFKTSVNRNAGDTAYFNEEHFPFLVRDRGLKLQLDVYNTSLIFDDFLGRAWVEVDDLIRDGTKRWFPLRRGAAGTKDAGEIRISARFQVVSGDDEERAFAERQQRMQEETARLQQQRLELERRQLYEAQQSEIRQRQMLEQMDRLGGGGDQHGAGPYGDGRDPYDTCAGAGGYPGGGYAAAGPGPYNAAGAYHAAEAEPGAIPQETPPPYDDDLPSVPKSKGPSAPAGPASAPNDSDADLEARFAALTRR